MIYLGIFSALLYALALSHYKWILIRTRIDLRTLLPVLFVCLFFFTSLLLPWFGQVEQEFFSVRNVGFFLLLIGAAITYNILNTRSMQRESLHEYEVVDLLRPLATILLAAVFFSDERDPGRLLLALVAIGIFLFTHFKHLHLSLKKAEKLQLVAVLLMAIELQLAKPLLELASPVALYAVRTGLIALVFLFVFRPRLSGLSGFEFGHLALNALLGVSAVITQLTVIKALGLVSTELIFLAIPLFLAVISSVFLHEKWNFRQTLAFVFIFACIAVLQLL